MATKLSISPEKAIIFPAGGDDHIVSGLQLETDPNNILLRIKPGRVRINGLYMDLLNLVETNCSAAPIGRSLIALNQSLNLLFIDDNLPPDMLVIGVMDKKLLGADLKLYVTQIEYLSSSIPVGGSPGDIFSPTVSMETQLRMLFEELSINKGRDLQLKYEELLESLPPEYNVAFVEAFEAPTYFVSNELVYNPYSNVISLGMLPPYPTDAKKLIERVTLPNTITTGYFVMDFISNSQTVSARLSFDDGVTWQAYTGDDYYSAGNGQVVVVEFTLQTGFSNVSPQLRSWALFYHRD